MKRALVILFLPLLGCAATPEPIPCSVPSHCERLDVGRTVVEAEELLSQNLHLQSIDILSAAYVCEEAPILLFHSARVYRAATEYETAVEYYERYLLSGDPEKRDEALAAVTACQAATSLPPVESLLGEYPCDIPLQDLAEHAAAYFDAGMFDDAVLVFQTAYDCQPDPILTYNIGRVHQAAGDCGLARDAFQSYVDSSDDRLRDQAIEYLNEMATCAAH